MPLVSKKLHCSVSGCDSDNKKNPPIKLYCFPRNKNRLAKWKLFCNNKKIEQRNDSYIRRHCRVCSKHFIKDDLRIITENNFRLAPEAIPRIIYPAENDLVQLDEVDFMDEENYDNSKDPTLLPIQDPSFPFSEDPILLSPIDNDSQDPILISTHDFTHLVSQIPSPSFDRRKRASKYPEVNEDFEKCHGGLNNVSIVKSDLKSLRRNSFLSNPKMKMLYKFTKKQEKDFKRLQQKYSKQNFSVEQVKKLSLRDLNEISKLSKRMAHTRYILKSSQIRYFLRTSKGRKWSLAEKVSALSLFRKMPKIYNTLRCIFVLPSKAALSSTLCKMNFSTGINYNVFEALMKKAKTMSVCEKHAILIFGKMCLRENLAYDSAQDRVFGFEDNGAHGRSNKRATHVLMFLACGLVQQWVQPVAYYLIPKNKLSTTLLMNHVTDVITICNAVGLKITATMCDSRPSFVQTLKNLGATPQDPTITIEGEKIITLLDPSHLLISTRNAIQKHDVAIKGDTDGLEFEGVASWQHIEDAYKRDKLFGVFRFLWRLTDNHLNPASCKEKMETKMAAQVFSHSVAAVLYSYVSAGQMVSEAMPTAHLVEFLDQLFDSFSRTERKHPDGKKIKCHVTNKSPHFEFWKKAYHFIDSWKFIEKNHTEELRVVRPVVQDGWLLTVSGIQRWNVQICSYSGKFPDLFEHGNVTPMDIINGVNSLGCWSVIRDVRVWYYPESGLFDDFFNTACYTPRYRIVSSPLVCQGEKMWPTVKNCLVIRM